MAAKAQKPETCDAEDNILLLFKTEVDARQYLS